jgi:hypothetical protein
MEPFEGAGSHASRTLIAPRETFTKLLHAVCDPSPALGEQEHQADKNGYQPEGEIADIQEPSEEIWGFVTSGFIHSACSPVSRGTVLHIGMRTFRTKAIHRKTMVTDPSSRPV